MPKHQLLRQVKAKSLSVKIPKNEPNTARLSWVLANEEFLTVEIPRYAIAAHPAAAEEAVRRNNDFPRLCPELAVGVGYGKADDKT